MKKLLCVLALLAPSVALAQLELRVSVKMILDGAGNRPIAGNLATDAQVRNAIDRANEIFVNTGRGYTFRLMEITNAAGISQWFNSDRTNSSALEAAAEANRPLYLYRDNAINVYINNWGGTAICSFPHDAENQNDIIFMGQGSFETSLAHEAGHYFDLRHTFEGEQFLEADNSACTNACACPVLIGGNNDLVADTISDHECWNARNPIAQGTFGMNYDTLNADQQTAVNLVYFNLMSYRTAVRDLLTWGQMDRLTDAANGVRFKVATGRTRFVAPFGNDESGDGSSVNRYRTLGRGVQVAAPGDIVLMWGGTYHAAVLTKRVTLRATSGAVTITR